MDFRKKDITILFLDDFRDGEAYCQNVFECYNYKLKQVYNYKEFCDYIDNNPMPDWVCFDHDLGGEKSGMDCAKYLVAKCQEQKIDIPCYLFQSANPVGIENMKSLLISYHDFYEKNYA